MPSPCKVGAAVTMEMEKHMTNEQFDLAVIGGGPAGYTAAIRAAQLGMKTVCIEKRSALGGTCLNIGCVPSKALLESSAEYARLKGGLSEHGIGLDNLTLNLASMMARKETIVKNITKGVAFLFKKNGVARVEGEAVIKNTNRISVNGVEPREIACAKMLIATGAGPKQLNGIPWDGDRIGDSTAALAYKDVPKRLIVIGAGAVGLELGTVWKRLGAEVTVLEFMDTILPGIDSDIAKQALRYFKRQKIDIKTGVRVQSAKREGDAVVVTLEGGETFHADRLLAAAGRTPNTEGLGLESIGVTLDARGFVQIDNHYETSVRGIFAAGDVVGGVMLAHKASEEGIACVEGIAGLKVARVNSTLVPAVVYTEPEIAAVGRTEDSLKAENVEYLKGEFLFRANARAQAHDAIDGSVKILADKTSRKLLGVHIIGPFAGELIAEACLALQCGLSIEEIAHTCHAHPTLSECLKEAALAALGRAVHG